VLSVLLAALSFSYLRKGYHSLFTAPADLHRRWIECRFILHGQDPFQIYLHHIHGPDADFNRNQCAALAAKYGSPEEPVYPPWAYAPEMLLVWPSSTWLHYYYALIDTACIGILLFGAIAIAKPFTRLEFIAVGLGTLAISSICTTLGNGNFGLIVTAALLLSVLADERKYPLCSGILLWIALVKPTISIPFCLIFILRRHFKPLIVAATLCAISCLYPWILDRVNPIEMLREAMQSSQNFQFGGYGMVNWLAQLGVPVHLVTPVSAILTIAPAMAFFLFYQHLPTWKNLAVLSVVGRFWGYHMAHDNIMLFFLSCAAWRIFFAEPNGRGWTVLLIVGASLWLPSSWTEHEWIGIIQHAIWLSAALCLAKFEPERSAESSSAADTPELHSILSGVEFAS
jgi:hypothetical protein